MKYRIMLCTIAFLGMGLSCASACDAHATPIVLAGQDGDAKTVIGVHGQYSAYDRPSGGGHRFTSAHTQWSVGYWWADRSAVQFGVPYLYRKLDDQSESGIGDVTVTLLYRLLHRETDTVTVGMDVYGGLKAPTGSSSALRPEAGGHTHAHAAHHARLRHHGASSHDAHGSGTSHRHHLALGSGSWDMLFGATAWTRRGLWTGHADLQHTFRTEGDHDFRYGDEWNWRVGIRYAVIRANAGETRLGLEGSGDYRSSNKRDGIVRPGSDTSATYVGPSIEFAGDNGLRLHVAYDVPIGNRDEGLHGAADRRVRFGVSRAL